VDQRFLGDEQFVERVDRRTGGSREIEARHPKVRLTAVLQAVAKVHGITPTQLVGLGRERTATPARALLVYLARQWGRVSGRELSRRLQRDPSLISRLYATYAAKRDRDMEARVEQHLGVKVNSQALGT
jgi:chromosomal replication initiation ATPase DnaA